jgi:hypothetical protein
MTVLTELEGPRPRGERRLQVALMAMCLLLFSGGLVGLVIVGDEAASPVKELASLQAFVEEAKTARFTTDEHTLESSGEGDVGTDYSSRSKIVGALQVPDRSQWTVDTGDGAYEGIVVPDGTYFRQADTVVELADEQWIYEKRHEGDGAEVSGELMMMAGGAATAFDAPQLVDMLEAAKTPERVDEHTIEAAVDVRRMPGFDPEDYVHPETEKPLPLPTVVLRLTSGPEHRLDRMVIEVKEKIDPSVWGDEEDLAAPTSYTATSDTRFTDWGAPQSITAPAPSAVDPTPYVDEEGVAGFDTMPLLGLRTLPGGFELMAAEVYITEDDADEDYGDCPEVDLSYGDAAAQDAAEAKAAASDEWDETAFPPTIEVELTPADCDASGALADDEGDPIRLGRHTGRIVRSEDLEDEYRATIQVVIGATRVTLYSDLPEAQTVAAAADLVPFDLATQPVHRVAPPA